jgi:hypothetical protein
MLAPEAERAQVYVTRTLRATIERIAAAAPFAAAHLRASIRTGGSCRYEPAPGGRAAGTYERPRQRVSTAVPSRNAPFPDGTAGRIQLVVAPVSWCGSRKGSGPRSRARNLLKG